MQLHVLDEYFRRKTLIDKFESMIWAERFTDIGDFELVIISNVKNRAQFIPGAKLGLDASQRVMLVETVENKQDEEGRQLLSIKGRSLELVLEERVATNFIGGREPDYTWDLPGTPGNIARDIFDYVIRNHTLNADDAIPYMTAGPSMFLADTIAEPTDSIIVNLKPTSVYKAIKDICTAYGLGFRIVVDPEGPYLYFDVYAGNDHRSSQNSLPSVVFSSALDNLTNVSELNSIATYKNTAYVFSINGAAIVVGGETGSSQTGFIRRVLYVNATDITEAAGTTLDELLEARGQEELAKAKKISAFDGVISQFSMYTYNDSYLVGDLVEMRTEDGIIKYVRVVEQIFVSDAEGDRSYPTLSDVLFITPGSWLDWKYNIYWADLNGYWLDLEADQ